MKILDQLRLVLLFKGTAEQMTDYYTRSLKHFEDTFSMEPTKSLRFDNNAADYRTLANASSASIQGELEGLGEISVTQYGISDEDPERYAFYNEAYEPLYVRFITTLEKYKRFISNNKVIVEREVSFRGATIVEYTTTTSDKLRYAICCEDDLEFSAQDITDFANQCNAGKTAVFCK